MGEATLVTRLEASADVPLAAPAVWEALLDRGVLVRETGPDTWLRVSIGTPAEMESFKHALQEVTR